ncbi:MAG: hypothetical protein SFV17_07290 [Candidatus Obscuribacter sp.]|nr:hypothetical protein [Candidatus Obscuribacter sp.]
MNTNLRSLKQELLQITTSAVEAAKQATSEKCEAIIKHAFQQLKIEAAAGRRHALVMSLEIGKDIAQPAGGGPLTAAALQGVAARVWETLSVFEPTLEFWSKEEGHQRDPYTVQGYNIVLHWQNSDDLLKRAAKLSPALRENLEAVVRESNQKVQEAAAGILSQLKQRAVAQAQTGKSWAIVMSLSPGKDFQVPTGKKVSQATASDLGPVATAVWEACSDFTPSLEYWSREEGQFDSYTVEGLNIVIHW